MGTELMKRGLEAGVCPETWNLDHKAALTEIHKAYRDAGADILLTNTFGANRWKLDAYGLGESVGHLNAAGVDLAREAARRTAGSFVAGDMGPTGRFVAPLGTDPREAFVEVFAEQANALSAAGVDAIALETFSALDELLAAVEAARATGLPVIASMSFTRAGPDLSGFRTMMGQDASAAAAALDAAGADVIGANCGTGPQDYANLANVLCGATKKPVLVEPNAGMPQLVNGRTVFPMAAAEFSKYVPAILAAGVRVIGGCCGTTSEHVRAIRAAVDAAR
jgi:5-methyltetrahydrofolate--homocysteine methyltransferase